MTPAFTFLQLSEWGLALCVCPRLKTTINLTTQIPYETLFKSRKDGFYFPLYKKESLEKWKKTFLHWVSLRACIFAYVHTQSMSLTCFVFLNYTYITTFTRQHEETNDWMSELVKERASLRDAVSKKKPRQNGRRTTRRTTDNMGNSLEGTFPITVWSFHFTLLLHSSSLLITHTVLCVRACGLYKKTMLESKLLQGLLLRKQIIIWWW